MKVNTVGPRLSGVYLTGTRVNRNDFRVKKNKKHRLNQLIVREKPHSLGSWSSGWKGRLDGGIVTRVSDTPCHFHHSLSASLSVYPSPGSVFTALV